MNDKIKNCFFFCHGVGPIRQCYVRDKYYYQDIFSVTNYIFFVAEDSQRPENENNHHEIIQENLIETGIDLKDETTSQIVDLLSEIKGCNNDCVLEPNFHPCLWCSGKLINV